MREEGLGDTCPHFHFVNYLSVVINQLIIMTNRNWLQLVLTNMTNQNWGGRSGPSGRFATHHAPNGTNFHTTIFYHPSCVPYWKKRAKLVLHRKIFYHTSYVPYWKRCAKLVLRGKISYQLRYLLQFLSPQNRDVHETAWTSPNLNWPKSFAK